MASHELIIDAQFNRAVEIVQSLPKTGPIQTDYEEKLTMYSLFKQATAGNVKSPRPGMWDMLGRAKWDAWAKHKDLDSYEARWLYVEALLKVLRKYSNKTIAMNLVQELESYGGDPSNIVMSRTLSQSPGSDASGSTVSEGAPLHARPGAAHEIHHSQNTPHEADEAGSSSDDESEDEANELPAVNAGSISADNRPQSSLSSHRYRTPLAGSLAMSPPPSQHRVPSQQPLPGFETPSAFADATSIPSSLYPPSHSFVGEFSESSRAQMVSPPHLYPGHPTYTTQMQSHQTQYGPVRPVSRSALERAVENVQVHLAALSERLETLESRSVGLSRSNIIGSPRGRIGSPPWIGGRGSPSDRNGTPYWDIDDMGMWSMVLNPLARGVDSLRDLATFFARNEKPFPFYDHHSSIMPGRFFPSVRGRRH